MSARQAPCGCFPTGQHYPGIAHLIRHDRAGAQGLARGFAADTEWRSSPMVVIDFETTGLDPEHDRILEIGLVKIDGDAIVRLPSQLINPGIPVPEEARAVHQISDEELADAPLLDAFWPAFLETVRGRLPVAYNAAFDRRFLHAEWQRADPRHRPADLEPYAALDPTVSWIDPLVWVRELQKFEKGKKLTDVCSRLGIALDNAHRAAADAEATGRVLLHFANDLPSSYGELMRIQRAHAKRQEIEFARWRQRQGKS